MAMNTQKAGNGVSLARRVLPDLNQQGEQDRKALLEMVARLQVENEALKAAKPQAKVWCKLSEKGAMSVYGMGRFPFTFYRSQWEAFERNLPMIKAWFEANKGQMTTKD